MSMVLYLKLSLGAFCAMAARESIRVKVSMVRRELRLVMVVPPNWSRDWSMIQVLEVWLQVRGSIFCLETFGHAIGVDIGSDDDAFVIDAVSEGASALG